MIAIRTVILGVLLLGAASLAGQKTAKSAGDLRVVLSRVQFGAEQSTLSRESMRDLDAVARLLQDNLALRMEIGAHTDASGSASYNLRLSQRRAQSVLTYLVKKGVSAKRLKAIGYGETKPLNRCKRGVRCSDAEKRQNRRIEILVDGLPSNLEARAEWLALNNEKPPKPVEAPPVPKMPDTTPKTTRSLPEANNSVALPRLVTADSTATSGSDFFPELTDKNPNTPKPLPATFIGYTIEIGCYARPFGSGKSILQQYDPIFLREEAGTAYCYYIGAFHTLTGAQDFLRTEALPRFPKARVVAFANNEKKYFSP